MEDRKQFQINFMSQYYSGTKFKQRQYKNRKLYINNVHESRGKNSWQKAANQFQKCIKKIARYCKIYFNYAKLVQHSEINQYNPPYQKPKEQRMMSARRSTKKL